MSKRNLTKAEAAMLRHETTTNTEEAAKPAKWDFSKKKETRSESLRCLLEPSLNKQLTDFAKEHKTSKNEVVIRAIREFISAD